MNKKWNIIKIFFYILINVSYLTVFASFSSSATSLKKHSNREHTLLYKAHDKDKSTVKLLSKRKRIREPNVSSSIKEEDENREGFVSKKSLSARKPLSPLPHKVYDKRLLDYAYTENEKKVRELLFIGVDVNTHDDDNMTALHRASWKGHTAIVATLLEAQAD